MNTFTRLAILLMLASMLVSCNKKKETPIGISTLITPTIQTQALSTEQSESGLFFVRGGGNWVIDGLILTGRLSRVGNCLRLVNDEDNESTLLVWSSNSNTKLMENNGEIEIVNVRGADVVKEGNLFVFSGTHFSLLEEWQDFIPKECEGPYYFVGSMVVMSILESPETVPSTRSFAIPRDQNLIETQWQLVELNSQPLPNNFVATLIFTSEGVEGYTGCNQWSSWGGMAVNDGLFFLPFAVSDPGDCFYSDLEVEFINTLSSTKKKSYYLLDSQLVVLGKDGKNVLVFDKK